MSCPYEAVEHVIVMLLKKNRQVGDKVSFHSARACFLFTGYPAWLEVVSRLCQNNLAGQNSRKSSRKKHVDMVKCVRSYAYDHDAPKRSRAFEFHVSLQP